MRLAGIWKCEKILEIHLQRLPVSKDDRHVLGQPNMN